MTYRVVWVRGTRGRLAGLLAGADPRVILAAARVTAVLEHCPRSFGESRPAGRRIGFVPPLAVEFEIDDGGQVARVFEVRSTDRSPGGDDPADPDDAA